MAYTDRSDPRGLPRTRGTVRVVELLVAVWATWGASACVVATDTSGLIGGAPADEATSTPVADAPTGSEVAVGGATQAAPVAAPGPVAASITSYCTTLSPAPRRCIDFESTDLTTMLRRVNAGSLSIDGGALLATMNDGAMGNAYLRLGAGNATPTRASFAYRVRLDGVRPSKSVEFGELVFRAGADECAIQPTVAAGRIFVNEYCAGASAPMQIDHDAGPVTTTTGWYRVSASVDFTTRLLHAEVRRPDGESSFVDVTLDARVMAGPAELRPGITYSPSGLTPAHRVWMDDVTFDWQ